MQFKAFSNFPCLLKINIILNLRILVVEPLPLRPIRSDFQPLRHTDFQYKNPKNTRLLYHNLYEKLYIQETIQETIQPNLKTPDFHCIRGIFLHKKGQKWHRIRVKNRVKWHEIRVKKGCFLGQKWLQNLNLNRQKGLFSIQKRAVLAPLKC